MRADLFHHLREAKKGRRPVVTITEMTTGEQVLLDGETVLGDSDGVPVAELTAEITAARSKDKARIVEQNGKRWFIHPHMPPKRMIIIGAVHISQALAPMAHTAGYDVIIVDPRTAWATEERFPGFALDLRWPDELMEDTPPDSGTAIIALTHDPKIDDPGLEIALRSDAFYIGALGSKKTHAKRVARLTEAGLTEAEIARIASPIGLDIGAVSQAEIAVAILAQVTLALRGPKHPAGVEK